MQLCDSLHYLHYNEIKKDNVVSDSNRLFQFFFSRVLVDFGKACLLVRQGKKTFTGRKDRYYKEHFHIAPEKLLKGPVLNLF